MNSFQKMGGIAALVNGFAYLVGIGLALTVLAPAMNAEPAVSLSFLAGHQTVLWVWHLLIYLVAGVFMVPLVLAMHEQLKEADPALRQLSTAFGLIWAVTVIASGMIIITNLGTVAEVYGKDPVQAQTVHLILQSIEKGLGGGIELPGGIWALLISWAALQTRTFPRALNVLGLLIGVAGILTVVPALHDLGSVFGMGFIVWFIWAGVWMLGRRPERAAQRLVR